MPTSGPLRGLMVISALWRCFSMARMTLLSNLSPRILRILDSPVSTDLRRAGVISHFLPVNSTFMSSPFFPDHIHATSCSAGGRGRQDRVRTTARRRVIFFSCPRTGFAARLKPCPSRCVLFLHSTLVSAGDAHVFPVFRDRATGDLNTLRLQDAGDLLVG